MANATYVNPTTNRAQRRRTLRLLSTEETSDFIAGDAIVWGKRRKMIQIEGEWKVHKMIDQWIGRFLRQPDGTECIFWYCRSEKVARRLYLEGISALRPDIAKRIHRCTSWSYGLQEDWMKDPVIFLDPEGATKTIKPMPFIRGYDYEDKTGEPSSFRGPYGMKFDSFEDEDNEPRVWVAGRLVKVGEVSDILVDATKISSRELEAVESQLSELENQANAYYDRAVNGS